MRSVISLLTILMLLPNVASAYKQAEEYKVHTANTPKDRCAECQKPEKTNDFYLLSANYESAKEEAEKNPEKYIFYEVPNRNCPDIRYASSIYLQSKEPCENLNYDKTEALITQNTMFCQYRIGFKVDSAMIQEWGRGHHINYIFESYATTKESNNTKIPYKATINRVDSYPVIYYKFDTKRSRNSKFIEGLVVGEISKKAFSSYERAKLWCDYVIGSSVADSATFKKREGKDNEYVCDGFYLTNMDKNASKKWDHHYEENGEGTKLCRSLNNYISNMQKSASDSTLIGATADWLPNGTVDGKQNYDCIVTIPQQ